MQNEYNDKESDERIRIKEHDAVFEVKKNYFTGWLMFETAILSAGSKF
jgi:hypothetical protein